MSSKNIAVAYCLDNKNIADSIENHLGKVIDKFHHFYGTRSTSEPSLAEQLQTHSGYILLIISDNFLKSAQCMSGSLKMLQQKGDRILPVVVDGVSEDEQSGEVVMIPTEFDRVSDIIQYINYWQDQYLDLRRQKRQLDDLDEEKFNAHLKVMRSISSEAGEFLRLLRSMNYLNYQEFAANHYEPFFRFVNNFEAWEQLKKLQPQQQTVISPPPRQAETEAGSAEPIQEDLEMPGVEVEMADIPGIDQLHEAVEAHSQEPEEEPILFEDGADLPSEEAAIPEQPASAETEAEDLVPPPDELVVEKTAAPPGEVSTPEEITGVIETVDQYLESGKLEMGIDLLEQAAHKYPESPRIHYRYALAIAQHSEDLEKASQELERAIELDPDNEDAHFLLGEFAEVGQHYDKARSAYEKVIALKADYPEVYYRLGVLLANNFKDKEKKAAKYFKQAAQKDPDNADALYQYALLLNEKLGKKKKAVKYLHKTLKRQADHPFANYDLALIYHRGGELEKARRFYLQAVAINPELRTEENERAFAVPEPEVLLEEDPIQVEHHTIEALRANINQLEELLRSREREEAQEKEKEKEKEPLPRIDKTVLITGATSGIGRATAEVFAKNGYRLLLNGRRKDRLQELKEAFVEHYESEVQLLPFDVRNQHDVDDAIRMLSGKWAEIDILINNAGKAKGFSSVHDGRLDHWDEMIDTNFKGLLYLSRAVAPAMVNRRNGHIINVGSIAGKEVYPKGNVYCATKAAVDALTKGMRLDLHTYNIRVSQVSPAHVEETEFALVRFDGNEQKARIYDDFQPLTATDVAETIFFIATRPAHVNIEDVVMLGTQQASTTIIDRSGRALYEEE